ncbi:MAG: N(4)-(beta-N-acetylglucosaminyl)-L-asparaginase, partial [Planctomycetota bacterium]
IGKQMERRTFLKSTTAATFATGLGAHNLAAQTPTTTVKPPVFVSTWKFGKAVNDAALKTLKSGGTMLDAIEKGIWVAEADVRNASVGIGGIPNADGVVQLDACIMQGPDHQCGSVAGLEKILHPISVARKVMEETVHVMLVGDGARKFAVEQGFEEVDLLSDNQRANFEKRKAKQAASGRKPKAKGFEEGRPSIKDNHDTIALLGLDEKGDIYGGCSTSGYGWKVPGRVGDSPIIGAGLYVDNEVGAVGATGLGENVMRYCASFMIVQEMRRGLEPRTAIEEVIKFIARKDPLDISKLSINFIALDKKGRVGAAGTNKGFAYAVTNEAESKVLSVTPTQ